MQGLNEIKLSLPNHKYSYLLFVIRLDTCRGSGLFFYEPSRPLKVLSFYHEYHKNKLIVTMIIL